MSVTGLEMVWATMATNQLPPDEGREVHVLCPAGKIPLSGGWANNSHPDLVVVRSEPLPTLDGWQVSVFNHGPAPINPTVAVRCLCADST